ncbi:galectin-3-binding protein A-like [Megalops cyprinoides]|uniref:galectin-3-binding protein A-like n=1 Tax=Megalops cyprinoides TaxID=118141 RepID=UPI00186479F6|nr:galectin-3-binding protein A-like [Megalops cyprinoides]
MLTFGITSPLWLMVLAVGLSTAAREGDVRLVGGKLSSEGRVEVYHSGTWGTVCDDSWDLAEAQVVCRQLRFPGAQSVVLGGTYAQGSGYIWLDDMDCKGTETSLSSCRFKGWGVTDCSHSEDAGVVCERNTAVNDNRLFPVDHSLGLSEDLGALFDSGRGCDLTIIVRSPEGDPDKEIVCAHRLVLSLNPDASFFNHTQGSKNLTMEVSQDCRPYVTPFLRYLYTRQIDISASSAQCLHKLASDLGVERLRDEAGQLFGLLLPGDASFHTPALLYEYAVQTEDLPLQETCLQYLAWNCEALMASPAWAQLSRHALEALLSRSDVAVPSEAALLQGVEGWIRQQGNSSGLEGEAALLRLVRFPMIPAEQLYELEFTSDLYKRHTELYRASMLRGFQFNALTLAQLRRHLDTSRQEFSPRIYTGAPWSLTINSTDYRISYGRRQHQPYGYNQYGGYYSNSRSFSTPVHSSAILQTRTASWLASVFQSRQECSNSGFRCDSVPAARLSSQSGLGDLRSSMRFSNRVLMACGGGGSDYVFHVQDFKNDLALIPTNSSVGQTYPCYEDTYSYRFVVRPEYV